jgi:hypothetical protein
MEDMLLQALKSEALITPLLALFLALAIAFYFWRRSGSSYGIKNRLYSILSGSKEFENPSFAELWHEQRDLERFNALFNLNAKSTNDVINFINWVKKYDLDIKKLSVIKKRFDIGTLRVKKINKWNMYLNIISILFLITFSILIAILGFSDSVLIKFKNDGQWIWLNNNTAQSFDINPLKSKESKWIIEATDCASNEFNPREKSKQTGLTDETIQVICKSFTSEEGKEYVQNALRQQRGLLWATILLLIWSVSATINLYNMLNIIPTRRHLLEKFEAYTKNRDYQRAQQ